MSQKLAALPELKKWMKKVMPFVAWAKIRVAELGLSALDLSLDFDEKKVLEDNLNYLLNTLQLDGVEVKFSTEANEKTQEECKPGGPFIIFRSEPSVMMTMINNQPLSGLFQTTCPILQGDSVTTIAKRMARNEKAIKDDKKIQLWRYQDPELGPRTMPNLEKPNEGKVQLTNGMTFRIDLDAQKVFVNNEDVGQMLVYRLAE